MGSCPYYTEKGRGRKDESEEITEGSGWGPGSVWGKEGRGGGRGG